MYGMKNIDEFNLVLINIMNNSCKHFFVLMCYFTFSDPKYYATRQAFKVDPSKSSHV